jgi:hypothetical protein
MGVAGGEIDTLSSELKIQKLKGREFLEERGQVGDAAILHGQVENPQNREIGASQESLFERR